MTVLFDLERLRPSAFDCIAQPVQGSDAWIAAPREHQPSGAAASDHLVVNQIGRHANQCEAGQPLTDDFVARGKRNEVSEPFERDALAGSDEARDGFGERQELTHCASAPREEASGKGMLTAAMRSKRGSV